MSDLEHQARLRQTELKIQRAKLIGVVATSMAAVATAAVVVVPMVSNQQLLASQPRQTTGSNDRGGSNSEPTVERGPTDESLCTHIMDVMKKEMGDAATQPSDEEVRKFTTSCVEEMKNERNKIGETEFVEQAKCVMAASRMEEMAKCEPD